jgi:hypothetical protein
MVVHGIILTSQLGKEHAAHLAHLRILVLHTLRHLAQLALDLDLAGQDEECERHQARPLDLQTPV